MRIAGIAVALFLGALASRIALHAFATIFALDLAQPLPVATNWGWSGALCWAILALALALAFVPYLFALRRPLSLANTLIACALALLAGACWLPLLSSDVYAYAAYGEMARIGLDPYLHHVTGDAIAGAANWQWRPSSVPICVYGSTFVTIARVIVALLHGFGIAIVLDGFRVLSCIALLLCGYAAGLLGGARAAAFLACNPIALWIALEGHNDTWMLAAVLFGFVVLRRAPAIGAAIVALAATIKLPALGASIALALDRILERRDARAVLGGTIAGCAAVAASSVALIAGVRSELAPHGTYAPLVSVQALGWPVALVVFAAVLSRVRAMTLPVDRWCVLALAAWVAIPNPYPWYALWLLPLGAFARDRRAATTVLTVSAAALLRYLPDAAATPPHVLSIGYGLIALTAFVPLVL